MYRLCWECLRGVTGSRGVLCGDGLAWARDGCGLCVCVCGQVTVKNDEDASNFDDYDDADGPDANAAYAPAHPPDRPLDHLDQAWLVLWCSGARRGRRTRASALPARR